MKNKLDPTFVKTTLYMDPKVFARLKVTAINSGQKLHQIVGPVIVAGLDVLAKKGK